MNDFSFRARLTVAAIFLIPAAIVIGVDIAGAPSTDHCTPRMVPSLSSTPGPIPPASSIHCTAP